MRITHTSRYLISAVVEAQHYRLFLTPSPSLRIVEFLSWSRSSSRIPLLFTMAGATENLSQVNGDVDDDVKFGFQRSEMYKGSLAGTVDSYDRHVFLCYKSPESWLPRVEESETDLLPKLFSLALKARKNDITIKTKFTICEGGNGTEFSDGDVLIFPEMIRCRGLKDEDVDSFVDDVLVNGKPWGSGVQEVLTGSHVFVCAHGSRDRRCGVCGPVLMDKLREEIETRGLKDQVFVSGCSHVGGHKYAGNLIIYSPDPEGKVSGHWYGYVTPDDVPEMLDQHIGKGEIIERLWRGQMGAYVEGSEKEKLPNGKDHKKGKKKHVETIEKENTSSCCQGTNGVSCCQEEKTAKKVGLRSKASSWVGKWEQSEVLAAVGVVTAVATVAVAYSFYKRSG